jgi:hypothetical protein
MLYMGRNLISKNTEGIWTKPLEPEVSRAPIGHIVRQTILKT